MDIQQKETPLELLGRQAQLLEKILESQNNLLIIHNSNQEFLTKWFNVIHQHQKEQTKILAGMDTVIIIFAILSIIYTGLHIFGFFR